MPTVPVEKEMGNVNWECCHCNHSWRGKPKESRANSGNSTCSSCGRRSGSQVITESDETPMKAQADDEVTVALLDLALKAAANYCGYEVIATADEIHVQDLGDE